MGFDHSFEPFEVSELPVGIVTETCAGVVSHAVGFDVGFVHDVDAVFVAEVVPAFLVRVVAVSYGVDVELLHQRDVFDHIGFGDGVASIGVHFMAVGAAHLEWFSVDADDWAIDFDLPESDAVGIDIDGFAGVIEEGDDESVEVWIFG